jgi:hypothetical protein
MILLSPLLGPVWLALTGLLHQTPVSSPASPPMSECMSRGANLVGSQPIQARGKLNLPKKRKHVEPAIQSVAPGTPAGSVVWIGEALVDTKGRTVHVWTLREPKLTPESPGVSEAIVAAIQQWEYEPLVIEKTPRPFCKIVTFTIRSESKH